MRASLKRAREELAARLRERREEIEQAILTRVHAVSDPGEVGDPEYAVGLREAISASIDYTLAAVEHGEERPPPLPAALLTQARAAVRNGVSLDTVLRRYLAGYTLVGDFLMGEAERGGLLGSAELKRLLRTHAGLFDQLIATVTEEYRREPENLLSSPERRRADLVKRLLDGELVEAGELEYDFDAYHLGAIAAGAAAPRALRELAAALERRVLAIEREDSSVCAWFGARTPIDAENLERILGAVWPAELPLALGEWEAGVGGWRRTHRQAQAAWPVVRRSDANVARYANVALLTSMLNDELLVFHLRERYLTPLEHDRDRGNMARQTLRAYFAAGRNISSAAARLGVSRQTVSTRLRSIEATLGKTLLACGAEVEAALKLETDLGNAQGEHATHIAGA